MQQGLQRLEELVRKINDVICNEIEPNLAIIAATGLLDLPSQQTFDLEDFAAVQGRFASKQTEALCAK